MARELACLIATGLVREVRGKETAAIWRTDAATGRTYALKLTAKGEIAVAEIEGEADTGAKSSAKRLDAARAPGSERQGAYCEHPSA